jgi:hypothetical protein
LKKPTKKNLSPNKWGSLQNKKNIWKKNLQKKKFRNKSKVEVELKKYSCLNQIKVTKKKSQTQSRNEEKSRLKSKWSSLQKKILKVWEGILLSWAGVEPALYDLIIFEPLGRKGNTLFSQKLPNPKLKQPTKKNPNEEIDLQTSSLNVEMKKPIIKKFKVQKLKWKKKNSKFGN